MQETSSPTSIEEVAIELVDPTSGRPVKGWTFNGKEQITIGRSPDQDVEISDPYVSRNHARLDRREEGWVLISLGRHGVVVANQKIQQHAVGNELTFRLGSDGPTLKFRESVESFSPLATISLSSSSTTPLFELDDDKLQKEVEEISDGNYFQELQRKVRELRSQRNQK